MFVYIWKYVFMRWLAEPWLGFAGAATYKKFVRWLADRGYSVWEVADQDRQRALQSSCWKRENHLVQMTLQVLWRGDRRQGVSTQPPSHMR